MTDDPISDASAAAERGEFESAIITLRPLAEAGNREAQYQLGFLALTQCDLISGREAFSLFLEASEQGHAAAMYHLATFPEFLSEPFKSPLSNEDAWRWLLRAAEGGCAQAQRDAGASLATGNWREGKVPQDLAAAIAWYRRAAEAGHADAQYNLASMLADGEGCDRDLPAAREWLRRAAAGGYEYAEGLLAHLDSLQQSLDRRDSESDSGFDSPESAAMVGFPPKYCRPIATRVNGDDAYVLLNTGSVTQPYLYGVNCRRESGRWLERGSANGPGWEQPGHDPDVGTLSFWDDAPVGADMVRVEFDGRIVEEPVIDRAFLVVWWRVPAPQDWP